MNILINSVFLDTQLLKDLLSVPHHYLKNYTLYADIYRKYFPQLMNIKTNNATFALRDDVPMPYIDKGIEPKNYREKRQEKIRQELFEIYRNDISPERNFYNSEYLKTKKYNPQKGNLLKEAIKQIYRNPKIFKHLRHSFINSIVTSIKQKQCEKKKNKGNLDFMSSFIDFENWIRYH